MQIHAVRNKLSIFLLLLAAAGWSQSRLLAETSTTPANEVGVNEQIGALVPADIKFRDEQDRWATLSELVDRPTILLMVFFSCPVSCGLMTGNLAGMVDKLHADPTKDYRILVASFDDEDTPLEAQIRRSNVLPLLPKNFPDDNFKFLTAARPEITRLTAAMGYHFRKLDTHQYVHPNALVVLSPKRKVIRYLYGPQFLPFDVLMALEEAKAEQPGVSIHKLMSLCFEFDRGHSTYVVSVFRIFAGIMATMIVAFVGWLIIGGRKPQKIPAK